MHFWAQINKIKVISSALIVVYLVIFLRSATSPKRETIIQMEIETMDAGAIAVALAMEMH